MALSRKDEQTVASIRAAAEKLRAIDEPDLAQAVDSTLTPEHRGLLTRAAWDSAPNLAMPMLKSRYDLIKEKQAGDKLADIIDAGFRRFLDGKFVPKVEPRAAWGTAGPKKTLNARPDAALHAEAAARCRELWESGERPGLAVANVGAHILFEHYRIGPYADDADTAG